MILRWEQADVGEPEPVWLLGRAAEVGRRKDGRWYMGATGTLKSMAKTYATLEEAKAAAEAMAAANLLHAIFDPCSRCDGATILCSACGAQVRPADMDDDSSDIWQCQSIACGRQVPECDTAPCPWCAPRE